MLNKYTKHTVKNTLIYLWVLGVTALLLLSGTVVATSDNSCSPNNTGADCAKQNIADDLGLIDDIPMVKSTTKVLPESESEPLSQLIEGPRNQPIALVTETVTPAATEQPSTPSQPSRQPQASNTQTTVEPEISAATESKPVAANTEVKGINSTISEPIAETLKSSNKTTIYALALLITGSVIITIAYRIKKYLAIN